MSSHVIGILAGIFFIVCCLVGWTRSFVFIYFGSYIIGALFLFDVFFEKFPIATLCFLFAIICGGTWFWKEIHK